MGKHVAQRIGLGVLLVCAALSAGPTFDLYNVSDQIWEWEEPAVYPPPWFEGMDLDTLSILLESGNLQWYEPRPKEPDSDRERWDAVVGAKVHAKPELVWKVLTDYLGQCRIMPKTFLLCDTFERKDNQVKNLYQIRTNVLQFGLTFEMVDLVTEDPPWHQHIDTIDGGLKGRELDVVIRPVDGGKYSLLFIRYFAHTESLGYGMKAILDLLPMSEHPVAAASANYHLRTHKNEAERLAGHIPPENPAPLDYKALDVKTLATLAKWKAGLIRETPEGKTINGLTYAFVDAPPGAVYDVITDLEHYNDFFKDQVTNVKKREGNQVWVYQKTTSQSVLIFTFSYEMDALYTLDPPNHISYKCVEGTYEGSAGDYYILPIEGGKRSILFSAIGINFEKDNSLTSRIIRSGDYPFNTVMDLLAARALLNNVKPEAEKRAGTKR